MVTCVVLPIDANRQCCPLLSHCSVCHAIDVLECLLGRGMGRWGQRSVVILRDLAFHPQRAFTPEPDACTFAPYPHTLSNPRRAAGIVLPCAHERCAQRNPHCVFVEPQ